jgi:hypothetical protein
MLNAQFDADVLVLRPDGPVTREDVTALTRTVDEYLAGHAKISGVMVQTQKFPGFASMGALADYARFIADHRARVRRVALVTDSALAPVTEFMANHVVGIEMRHYPVCRERGSTGVAQVDLTGSEAVPLPSGQIMRLSRRRLGLPQGASPQAAADRPT